jgi:hypothetical protein
MFQYEATLTSQRFLYIATKRLQLKPGPEPSVLPVNDSGWETKLV